MGRNVGACRISQIEGTEKSTSLFVSEVCRAPIVNVAKVHGIDVETEIPDAVTSVGGTQPTCTRELLEKPVKLEGSGGNDHVNPATELGVP